MKPARSVRRAAWTLAVVLAIGGALAGGVVAFNRLDESSPPPAGAVPFAPAAAQVSRGAYLARAGNCASCHTAPGGPAYAGGAGLPTPFGTVYGSNLTPDLQTGIGSWSADDFWRALHNGRSRDGRLLAPAFPYASYTRVTREDADALFAFLLSQPPQRLSPPPQALRFPYGTQAAFAVWRAAYFRPATFQPDAARSAEWNRGAYLVRGLGHCGECHSPRNTLGATLADADLAGGTLAAQGWYAPSLRSRAEASAAGRPLEETMALLRDGVTPHACTMGPMAEVVFNGTQHLSETDLRALAIYLQALPPSPDAAPPQPRAAPADTVRARGSDLYGRHCADCHGEHGEGSPGRPALAGNRALSIGDASNVIQAVLHGGYAPATAGNPRPFGMPPFQQTLEDADVAAVAGFIRTAWGNSGGGVEPLEVYRLRGTLQ